MKVKEIYSVLNNMVEVLGLNDYPVRVHGVNGFDYRIDAEVFCYAYRDGIEGTAYENATVHAYERGYHAEGIEFALNGKVLANLVDDQKCDPEWLREHFYEVFADEETMDWLEDEIYEV